MTCRKHPELEESLRLARERVAELEARLLKVATALDRYGRHERGCRFSRTNGRCACTCLLHERIRDGGLKP
ncbi:hypothetical protein [Myxococcus virescens]|uniref:Uncharacterized protein n=1 Tax=Myxococcus virescens TaxID=83456 RepID=A0A511HMM0_9BACT|nr:hypothetical protein [Myxococcus virescens]GEL74644.1 hypothetical protein MVI01_64280 [Myxococcus virescens]SDE54929.1 hypothetical protein SAMN04488504_108172 [Myxococcus virescens]